MKSIGVKRLRRWVATLIAVCLSSASSLPAQTVKPTEYQVKAAYLANFAKFVEWPAGAAASAEEPYSVCILGRDPFGPALDAALAGENAGGHPLVPRRLTKASEAAACRVLFIAADAGVVKNALTALDKAPVLTVSGLPQFLKYGGVIQFILEGNRVRFEVNLTAAKNAGLNLSSELLKVAAAVRRDP